MRQAIAGDRPQPIAQLRRIKGMGPVKLDQYGAEILAIVARLSLNVSAPEAPSRGVRREDG